MDLLIDVGSCLSSVWKEILGEFGLNLEVYVDMSMLTATRSSSIVHIYTQTIHRTTQLIWDGCRPCTVIASYSVALTLQLRKKHGKNFSQGSQKVPVGTFKTEYTEQDIHKNKNN
jgi:uncharacterized integral membrane protein